MPRISHYIKATKALGPGNRFCIWFQGCNKRCSGCINKEGQDVESGVEIENSKLIEVIKKENSITGVTISGGEPFLQSEELLDLVKMIKQETKLDVMIYSGYTYDELNQSEIKSKILKYVDILIDGEYKEELNNNEMYRGSSNQKIYILSDKYKKYEEKIMITKSRSVEFQVTDYEELVMIGIPPKGFYDELINNIMIGE